MQHMLVYTHTHVCVCFRQFARIVRIGSQAQGLMTLHECYTLCRN